MGRKWKIIWPERRLVDDSTILSWARDAVANGELHSSVNTKDVSECANALDQAGLITLSIEK